MAEGKKEKYVFFVESDNEVNDKTVTFISRFREFRFAVPLGKEQHVLVFRGGIFRTKKEVYINALKAADCFGTLSLMIFDKLADTRKMMLRCGICGYEAKDSANFAEHCSKAHGI